MSLVVTLIAVDSGIDRPRWKRRRWLEGLVFKWIETLILEMGD